MCFKSVSIARSERGCCNSCCHPFNPGGCDSSVRSRRLGSRCRAGSPQRLRVSLASAQVLAWANVSGGGEALSKTSVCVSGGGPGSRLLPGGGEISLLLTRQPTRVALCGCRDPLSKPDLLRCLRTSHPSVSKVQQSPLLLVKPNLSALCRTTFLLLVSAQV